MLSIFRKRHNRYLRKIKEITREINVMEPTISISPDSDIKERVLTLRTIVQREIHHNNSTFLYELKKDILIEGIAILREVSKRILGERPYDEQIWAGLALLDGNIVEMRNGEGKTLAATIPVFLESLKGKRTHLVTANDHLANDLTPENCAIAD